MTDKEYEHKKRECWEKLWDEICGSIDFTPGVPDRMKEHIYDTFDRAYALGKEKEIITQKEIEKAAEDYVSFEKGGKCYPSYIVERACCRAFKDGVNFALGKQEKNADIVIQEWAAIDEAYDQCFLHTEKPIQKAQSIADTGDYDTVWDSNGKTYLIDTGLFPDMNSDSCPIEVELIIRRKKNG